MIRLVVSDIDGTLLPYGQTALSPELFSIIEGLREQNILFCPASGRQYHSLRTLFAPVADEIAYLCENGAILYGPGGEQEAAVLAKTPMDKGRAVTLAEEILSLPGCEVVVSGANVSYLSDRNPEFVRHMETFAGNRVCTVARMADIPEDILKVAAYYPGSLERLQSRLGPRWSGVFRMAVAGTTWLDFTAADKGIGLRSLCAALGVAVGDVMAFGDNFNDLPMLETAGTAYLMASAVPALKQRISRHCDTVEGTLKGWLERGIWDAASSDF